jgi:hypothetical protein
MNPQRLSQHTTFGNLHIHVSPMKSGTWMWIIRKVKDGTKLQEGVAIPCDKQSLQKALEPQTSNGPKSTSNDYNRGHRLFRCCRITH